MHIAFTWWPDPSGGTEVYVKGLVAELQKMGVESVVAAPTTGRSEIADGISDQGNGVRIRRFRCSDRPGDLGEIYGEGDPVAAESFKRVLDEEKPDIAHFHAWSPAISILLVREVKRRGIRMVQTYHTPTLSCPRGTLMRWGRVVCDGDLAKRPCALCAIHGKLRKGYRIGPLKPTPAHPSHLLRNLKEGHLRGGIEDRGERIEEMPDTVYRIQGAKKTSTESSQNPESEIQNPIGSKLSALTSKLTTMLRMPGLIRKSIKAIRESFEKADRIVALNQWSFDLLIRNEVPKEKIILIRHGIPEKSAE